MQAITGGGAFTKKNIEQLNANFALLSTVDIWVRPQNGGSNTNPGTFDQPLATMAGCNKYLRPGLVIGLQGVLFETWLPPACNDITIVGMMNQPRQATSSGSPNGGGATWLNATNGTAGTLPLVRIGGTATETKESQGWTFRNIFFANASTSAVTSCVELMRGDGAGVDVGRDASHASFYGCKFTGANFGIRDSGGASFVHIEDCEFFNFASSGDTAIKEGTDTDVALPLQWVITGNRFWNNYAHLVIPLSSADIYNNMFGYIGSSITTTVQVHIDGGGKNNTMHLNRFQMAEGTGTATMFGGGTTDSWLNYYTDALTTGVPI